MTREKRTVAWNEARLAGSTKAVDVIVSGPLETIFSPVERSHATELVDNIFVSSGEHKARAFAIEITLAVDVVEKN